MVAATAGEQYAQQEGALSVRPLSAQDPPVKRE
jgi:hypothetical protein